MEEKKQHGKHANPAVLIRLPAQLLEDFDRHAAAGSYTRAELVRELMRRYVDEQDKKLRSSTMDFNPNADK